MCSATKTSSKILFTTIIVFSFSILTVTGFPTKRTTVKPGTILQNELNKMNQRMDQIDFDLLGVMLRLSDLENNKPGTSSLEKKVDSAEKSIKHLQSVNEIWKSNFKSIKESFQQLKEKKNFARPTIN